MLLPHLVGEKRCVATLITAAEETIISPDHNFFSYELFDKTTCSRKVVKG